MGSVAVRANGGIGADGVILVQPDAKADFRMRIFNRDGSEAESCGNGLRCFFLFLEDLGVGKQTVQVAVSDQIVEVFRKEREIGVRLNEPRNLCLNVPIQASQEKIHFVNTGVPHAVLFVPDVQEVDVPAQGSWLRYHRAFKPHGANVNFASLLSDGSIQIRTYERGVEGETRACGTGAAAVGVIAAQLYDLPSPIRIRCSGGEIRIQFSDQGLADLCLIGPAQKIFQGNFFSPVLNDSTIHQNGLI